jgi:hypothetical protein
MSLTKLVSYFCHFSAICIGFYKLSPKRKEQNVNMTGLE